MSTLQLDQPVITPTGRTGRVVARTRYGRVRVRLDPFVPNWDGAAAPRRELRNVEVVYVARDLQNVVLNDPDAVNRLT